MTHLKRQKFILLTQGRGYNKSCIMYYYYEIWQSLNLNSEVDYRLYDRHLEKSI